jgi:hypothetical protein
MYVTEPNPLRMFDGSLLAGQGVSHAMHTLAPHANGGRKSATGAMRVGTPESCYKRYF